jgi:hypothetical protein
MVSHEKGQEETPLIVQWPLLYANKELVGQGTLTKISHRGCEVTGTMPVASGMVLQLWISPGHREDALYVREARVLWSRANEFGLELRQVDAADHEWLMRRLTEREHTNPASSTQR